MLQPFYRSFLGSQAGDSMRRNSAHSESKYFYQGYLERWNQDSRVKQAN
jgi:hypothetical protein